MATAKKNTPAKKATPAKKVASKPKDNNDNRDMQLRNNELASRARNNAYWGNTAARYAEGSLSFRPIARTGPSGGSGGRGSSGGSLSNIVRGMMGGGLRKQGK